jgi:sugar-specific transcriptional regulator TrmB
MVVNELLNLGLSQKEAEVYLATLQLGQATVQNIAKKAEINRTTAYTHIKNLIARGLIGTSEKFGKQYFVAEKPEKLKFLFEQQELEFLRKKETVNRLMPELESIYNIASDRPSTMIYKNSESEIIRKEILSKRHNEFCEMINTEVSPLRPDVEYAKKLLPILKSYRLLVIAKKQPSSFYQLYPFLKNENLKTKFLPVEKFNIPCGLMISDDFVQISHTTEFIILKDKLFSKTIKLVFDLFWEIAEDY